MGITGKQGVMIPRRNIGDLMLDSEVVEECKKGNFHIWAVDHVDQGIEILTGIPAGQADEEGNFPEGTINYLANNRLDELSEALKEYESHGEEETEEPEKDESAEPSA
jgi:predicted ATP-dependent protease